MLIQQSRPPDHAPSPGNGRQHAAIGIIDADPAMRDSLSGVFAQHGFDVEAAPGGALLGQWLAARSCDVVILDPALPDEDGHAILRRLGRERYPPGLIIFSSVSTEVDRIVALEMGADAFVTKPCSSRELLAHVRSVLRRRPDVGGVPIHRPMVHRAAGGSASHVTFADFTFDKGVFALFAPGGDPVQLSDKEARMLAVLIDHAQSPVSRAKLLSLTHDGAGEALERAVDVQISRLRRKLAKISGVELVRTVRGRGYLFLPEVVPL